MQTDWIILYDDYQNGDLIDDILEYNNKTHKGIQNKNDILYPEKINWVNAFELPNIRKGIERVKQAIENNENILIAGDYDADGVTATAIMFFGIRSLTPNVYWTVPNRSDGYGLSTNIVSEAMMKKCSLIVTVDNGIVAFEAIEYANQMGIDVIVTDHHQPQDKLPCDIVIAPLVDNKYPFKNICGCMVAFKFLQALLGKDMVKMSWYKEAFALTAIATIADVMILQNENRRFVNSFLNMLKKKNSVGLGLDTLFKNIKGLDLENVTSTDIAFSVVPCINAMGRLDDAKKAVELFLTEDCTIADKIAKKMIDLNSERKKYQNEIRQSLQINENTNVIVEVIDKVPSGIVGIVAGSISSKYNRPCYLMVKNEDLLFGSGRAPEYGKFNVGSFVANNKDICFGGGHKGACGVKLLDKNLEEFKSRCEKEYKLLYPQTDETVVKKIIFYDLKFSQINNDLMNDLCLLEPYGSGNRAPLFCSRGVYVSNTRICGDYKNTLQMEFFQNNKTLKGICFYDVMDKYINELQQEQFIDICYTLQYNYWQGNKSIQLLIEDFKPSKIEKKEELLEQTKKELEKEKNVTFF